MIDVTTLTRVYSHGGRCAHYVAGDVHDYTRAICGAHPSGIPWLPTSWMGAASQGEYDRAQRLRTCRSCAAWLKRRGAT